MTKVPVDIVKGGRNDLGDFAEFGGSIARPPPPPACSVTEEKPRENPDGFDDQLREICREDCAEFGDPPCWMLPELVQPCEHITPCDGCLAKAQNREP